MFFKKGFDKKTKAYWDQIQILNDLFEKMVKLTSEYLDNIEKRDYGKCKGELAVFPEYTNMLENFLTLYMNKYVTNFYREYPNLSYSYNQMEDNKRNVIIWLNNINKFRMNLINALDTRNIDLIMESFLKFNDALLHYDDLIKMVANLRTITIEYIQEEKNVNEEILFIFKKLRINKKIYATCIDSLTIKKYDKAVFDAMKIFENNIKNLSKCKNLFGDNLINSTLNPDKPIIILLDKDIQTSLFYLSKGIMPIRNMLAHDDKITLTRENALKCICIISYLLDILEKK